MPTIIKYTGQALACSALFIQKHFTTTNQGN